MKEYWNDVFAGTYHTITLGSDVSERKCLTKKNYVPLNNLFSLNRIGVVAEYEAGLTPNPDVECNRYLKFGHFRLVEMQT